MTAQLTAIKNFFTRISQNRALRAIFWILLFALTAAAFGAAYTMSPLYEGNQNTKFLHGLALAGRGFLSQDWLANTADPLPVFTWLVALTARINEDLFYVYYFLMFGIYSWSLVGIASEVYPTNKTWTRRLVIFTLLLVYHSKWILKTYASTYSIDMRLIQYGLADQYLLGEEFQNSTMGVFLLLSIYFFLRRKYVASILLIGVASLFHSAYLFSAALMVAAYCSIILWEKLARQPGNERWELKNLLASARQPVLLGFLALAFALPLVLYNQIALPSSDPETARQALHILVQERIPHHTQPAAFMNRWAYLQVGLMLVGILLAWRSRLTPILITLFAVGALFTGVQILTASDSLGLLGPWRVSVLLVPISTVLAFTVALSFVLDVLRLRKLPYQWIAIPVALYYIFFAVREGIDNQRLLGKGFRANRVAVLMDHAVEISKPGETYLIPPLEAEFDDFRIYTGIPILANWKSHPYKDLDVLEWYHRVRVAQDFYIAPLDQKCGALETILAEYPQITHVVNLGKEVVLPCDFLQEDFRYLRYTLYSVHR